MEIVTSLPILTVNARFNTAAEITHLSSPAEDCRRHHQNHYHHWHRHHLLAVQTEATWACPKYSLLSPVVHKLSCTSWEKSWMKKRESFSRRSSPGFSHCMKKTYFICVLCLTRVWIFKR